MTDERALLIRTAELAAQYIDTLDTRPIRPDADYAAMLQAFDGPVPEEGMDPIALVDELAAAAERKQRPGVRILRGDFIREPVWLFVGAELVVFCGSLNTVEDGPFYQTLRRGFDATAWGLVFNFLSSPELAGASHLHWRHRADVERFVETFGALEVRVVEDYLRGDCTMGVFKVDPHA